MKIKKIIAVVVDDNGDEQEVVIERCYESYEQYGASYKILQHTMPLAEVVTPFLCDQE